MIKSNLEDMDHIVSAHQDRSVLGMPRQIFNITNYNAIITNWGKHGSPYGKPHGLEVIQYNDASGKPIPTLLHSGRDTGEIDGEEIQLKALEEKFEFLTFHVKSVENMGYIKEFLTQAQVTA